MTAIVPLNERRMAVLEAFSISSSVMTRSFVVLDVVDKHWLKILLIIFLAGGLQEEKVFDML